MKTIAVNADALHQVLQALVGPGHCIRELQFTRSLHKLGHTNAIETLIENYEAAAPSPSASAREPMLSAADLADLQRLQEVFDDGEGWDIPSERMKRLAELGVVRWHGRTRYSITAFGMHCLGDLEFPLQTVEEHNAAAHAEMLARNGITARAAVMGSGEGK